MSTRPLRLVSAAVCTAFGVLVAAIGGFGTLASAFDDSRDNDLWVYIVFGLGLIGVGVLLLGLAHALAFPHGSARTRVAAAPVVVATFFPYASALEGLGVSSHAENRMVEPCGSCDSGCLDARLSHHGRSG
jgi:hypothetical protein